MQDDKAAETGPIYLVGMMGAGKSTLGPALAERLGWAFVDTDEAIEAKAGRRISAIFAEEGEAYFRTLEREAIEAASKTDCVMALGGGAFSQPGAAEEILARGIVVYLDASTELILERVGDAATRPLLAGLSATERAGKLHALREERAPDFAKASIRINAEGTTENLVNQIIQRLPLAKKHATGEPPKRTQDG